jgi:hypothetical protein
MMKRTLRAPAMVMLLAGCGDVEEWAMVAYTEEGTVLRREYSLSEEKCHKHGRAAKTALNADGYRCDLVAFHENLPGGELSIRALMALLAVLEWFGADAAVA